MKQLSISILFIMLMSMVGTKAYAYDIAVENADGVCIYYNYFNDGLELEVTHFSYSYDYYRGDVVIPEEVTYMNRTRKVTCIGNNAFSNCTYITSITIPNSVTSIGNKAFMYCSGLTSVTIGNSVTSIGEEAFCACTGLTSITIPNSVTNIGGNAFSYCTDLTSITIPNSVTNIGEEAFAGCYGLTLVTIGNSVANIGSNAFENCSNLNSVHISDLEAWCKIIYNSAIDNPLYWAHYLYLNGEIIKDLVIPNSVTSIGAWAFYGCRGLTSVSMGDGVTSIGNGAFYDCNRLTSVMIGSCVTSIGERAFENCSRLSSITIPNSVTSIGNEAFSGWDIPIVISLIENPFEIKGKTSDYRTFSKNTFNNATLYVPTGTIDKYKETEGWKDFLFIEEGDYVGVYKLTYMVDGEVIKSFDVIFGETIIPEPAPTKEGYTFSGWSEIPETMPDHDVIVMGTFTINKYKLTYTVDGEEYKSIDVEYGSTITPESAPTKEGYTFSGWSEIPETMPDHDVTVTGTFSVNSYKLTYMIDDQVYKETMYEYGATITPEPQPEGDYATFEWIDLPQTMPAHDVVIYASYTSGISGVLMTAQRFIHIYSPNGKKLDKMQKGFNIVVQDDGTVKKFLVK